MQASLSCPAQLVAADVDWLTMSTDESGGHAALLEWRDRRFRVLGDEGYRETAFSSHGYQYRQRGQIAVGSNGRRGVCTVSGVQASANWRDLVGIAANVSRVDLALTSRPNVASSTLASESYRPATSTPRGRGRPISMTLILGQDRGETLYVGSRKSDVLGRLYDKARESREPAYAGCWRWEIQYRRASALQAARSLLVANDASATIAATVGSWFRARDVCTPAWTDSDPLDHRAPKPLPDDQRWLAWARKSVQPRARELVKRYGWRFVAEQLAGGIATYEDWETMVQGLEFELQPDHYRHRGE